MKMEPAVATLGLNGSGFPANPAFACAAGQRPAMNDVETQGRFVTQHSDSLRARRDLAWSIAVGGCAIVGFGALLALTWYTAETLLLLFAGVLFGVFLNALTDLLGRVVNGYHALRLTLVCVLLTAVISGVLVLGGAETIAQQASVLNSQIRSQLGTVKDFLERRGIDTSFLETATTQGASLPSSPAEPRQPAERGHHRLQHRRDHHADDAHPVRCVRRRRERLHHPAARRFLRRAAGDLSQRVAEFHAAQISGEGIDDHRRNRRRAAALAARADRHHDGDLPDRVDRPRDHRHSRRAGARLHRRAVVIHSDRRRIPRRRRYHSGKSRFGLGRGRQHLRPVSVRTVSRRQHPHAADPAQRGVQFRRGPFCPHRFFWACCSACGASASRCR